jgi:hypothetical protein
MFMSTILHYQKMIEGDFFEPKRKNFELKKALNHSDLRLFNFKVAPAGIEPASSESESEILSIEIRSRNILQK